MPSQPVCCSSPSIQLASGTEVEMLWDAQPPSNLHDVDTSTQAGPDISLGCQLAVRSIARATVDPILHTITSLVRDSTVCRSLGLATPGVMGPDSVFATCDIAGLGTRATRRVCAAEPAVRRFTALHRV